MIDLLLENPAIIGVIVFFLWKLFRPSKEEQNQQREQKRRPVSTDMESPYEENKAPEIKQTTVAPNAERKALTTTSEELENKRKKVTLTQSTATDAVTFDYAKEKQKLEERKKQAQAALNRLNQGMNTSSQTTQTRSVGYSREPIKKPSQAQLREAIVWSEILGKPKARKNIK